MMNRQHVGSGRIGPRVSVLAVVALAAGVLVQVGDSFAQALQGQASAGPNIRVTRHNFSSGAASRQATSENTLTTEAVITPAAGQSDELCVYCHTPHGASSQPNAPLWNRSLAGATYTPYSSSSLQAADLDVNTLLANSSKTCLSCHDGTVAIGAVSNAPGSGAGTAGASGEKITIQGAGTAGQYMPYGRGLSDAEHGFTRRLGTDLRNDHPIAFTFDATLATADGELRDPVASSNPKIADRVSGQPRPDLPLFNNTVQCSTCHEPHRATQKFLNLNRLQTRAPETTQADFTTWSFDKANDQICLGCHTRLGKAWAVSAHANSQVAAEAYNQADAAVRDFPTSLASPLPVWKAGCLNCHDTHTAAGSRRLLREGVNSGFSAVSQGYAANVRAGVTGAADYSASSALENACYQCHSASPVIATGSLTADNGVPNIESEFARTYHMPIKNTEQGVSGNTSEVHDISDVDGSESQTQLGFFANENRHAECADCHNPHRVVKADTILGGLLSGGTTTRRTHIPARGTGGVQGNIASGALRGAWGVEPSYSNVGQQTRWMNAEEAPTFTVVKGDPGSATTLPVGKPGTEATPYLTREYQLCFKCHSNYANGLSATDYPSLKATNATGGTASGTNRMTRYTNVAAEFAAWATDTGATNGGSTTGRHQGEAGNAGGTGCAGADCTPVGAGTWDTTPGAGTYNHRSWHPVVVPTGRTNRERYPSASGGEFNNIRAPFDKVGTQTMQCSDCHGSEVSWNLRAVGTGPNLAQVQGPHGSNRPFLLKGDWGNTAASPTVATTNLSNVNSDTSLCGKCHFPVGTGDAALRSGLNGNHLPDGNMTGLSCTRCHVAVPHGWKNKAFLVNKRCVGVEGGEAGDCVNRVDFLSDLNAPPYYLGARNSFLNWRPSGDSNYSVEDQTCNNVSGGSGNMKDCVSASP